MKEHAFRLTKGSDLKISIEKYCIEHQISAAVVLSLVGCVDQAHLRMAGGKISKKWCKDFEVVGCTGTVSSGKAHLHAVLSDIDAICYGGHLQEGCLVNTTCEVVLGELESYEFTREEDESTGYREIVIRRK